MIYCINSLLILAGLCDVCLGAVAASENILLSILAMLSGILTVLIGCLTAAFLSHLANHNHKNADVKQIKDLILDLKKELKRDV
jgi:predicted transporter